MQITRAMKDHMEKAQMYGLLADYYRYLNPEFHIWYYRLHEYHMRCVVYDHMAMARNLFAQREQDQTTQPEDGQEQSGLRIFHASPDAPAVDVYLNGQLLLPRFGYRHLSDIYHVPGRQVHLEVYVIGQTDQPLVTETFELLDGCHTLVMAGRFAHLMLLSFPERQMPSTQEATLRFWHLSPDAPALDIKLDDQTILSGLTYKQASEDAVVSPGLYTLEGSSVADGETMLVLPGVQLMPGQRYTAAIVGFRQFTPGLEWIFLPACDA